MTLHPTFLRNTLLLLLLCACMFTLAACSSAPKSKVRGTSPYTVRGDKYYPLQTGEGYDEIGMASWYGPGFHGKKTANGERYNQNAMTAAHKLLPLGTVVKVTNLENDESVVLRVNDRGPFKYDRIIDVSRRAAHKLGMHEAGTARVRVEAISENGKKFSRTKKEDTKSEDENTDTLNRHNGNNNENDNKDNDAHANDDIATYTDMNDNTIKSTETGNNMGDNTVYENGNDMEKTPAKRKKKTLF